MSDNMDSDVRLNENQDGTVSFASEVVATIAGLAATEVEGVSSMTSSSSGFADMFSRKNSKNFTKGVRIDLEGNTVNVDISIVVEYGSPVPDVARGIQENVKKAIETMSGLEVKKIDIHIAGISFEKEQRANEELDEQQRKLLDETDTAEEHDSEADLMESEEEPSEVQAANGTESETEESSEDDKPEADADI